VQRQNAASSWTVNALEAEGVLQPFGVHLASGTRVVFTSSTPSVLRTLAAKAGSPLSAEEWSANLNQTERSARDDLVQFGSLDNHGVHDRLTRLTVRTMDEGSLYFAVIEALAAAMDGDADTALSLLGAFVVNHLMERFDRPPDMGLPAGEGDLAADRLRPGVVRTRQRADRPLCARRAAGPPPRLPLLPRAEVDRVVQALTAPDGPRTVAVTGRPAAASPRWLPLCANG